MSDAKPKFRSVPEGVTEDTGLAADGSILATNDGTLMLIQGGGVHESAGETPSRRFSEDGGQTWSDPVPLSSTIGAGGVIRLHSGALAMYGTKGRARGACYCCTSRDDGHSWSAPVEIPAKLGFYPMYHSMIQLTSGRILLVGYWGIQIDPPDARRYTVSNSGLWRDRWLWMEGHRTPGIGMALVHYSDDEGKTWSPGGAGGALFGWFDECGVPNGEGGVIGIYEPTAAQADDGRVLLFARSKTGRLVQSYSMDGGQTWYSILPTELASSAAPPMLVQIPKTRDLLCVWNQVSAEEIRRGYHRGRLSAAISTDSGLTWKNFRTIELMEGMEDIARITPEVPVAREIRGRPGLGQLPDSYAMFTYSNVDIVGDQVFVRYSRQWPVAREGKGPAPDPNDMQVSNKLHEERGAEMRGERVIRRYPLAYFYEQ